jgi:flagellar hook-associated protein 1
MSGLSGTLSIALSALQAAQSSLAVTTNNVANANTPGYTRQRAVLTESPPVLMAPLTFGTGVTLEDIQSLRDPILQVRIQQETQQQGQLGAFVGAMQQAQVMFNSSSGDDIGSQLSNFFSSISQLSSDPSNLALRQGVLTASTTLANAFHTTAANLNQQRSSLDQSVVQTVQQVNTLTTQLATLNGQINGMQKLGEDVNTLVDQRDQAISQLSELIDVSTVQSDNGLTLTTSAGVPLVVGGQSYALSTQQDSSGVQHIFSLGTDVTDKLTSGKIAGLLEARDQKIPTLLSNLDTLAAGLASGMNTAQGQGTDLSGAKGGNFFVVPPTSSVTACNFAVQITDPSLIAASSDGTTGSNGNVANLLGVHDQLLAGGLTLSGFYSNMVFSVGNDVSSASAEQTASQLMLNQLQDQRGSISGVSLDEEASNMLKFQQAYEAAARVVTTVNDMMTTAVNLGKD